MNIILAIIGFLVLVGGSQIYWLYVGGIFTVFASHISSEFRITSSTSNTIVSSLAAGTLGILSTHFLRKIMTVIASAIAGGYLSFYLPTALGWNTTWLSWVTILIASVICAVIVFIWYAVPVSILSSLFGATVIVQNLKIASLDTLSLFIILFIFGIITQWILMQYSSPEDM